LFTGSFGGMGASSLSMPAVQPMPEVPASAIKQSINQSDPAEPDSGIQLMRKRRTCYQVALSRMAHASSGVALSGMSYTSTVLYETFIHQKW